MGMTNGRQFGKALGSCLLLATLLRWAGYPPAHPQAGTRPVAGRRYPRFCAPRDRPFDIALRTAIEWQQRAVDQASRSQEALVRWDPQAVRAGGPSNDWQKEVALDGSGCLRRANAEAQRAADLARTRHELCRAGALLASLECRLGHHDRELQQARRIAALEPGSELALYCLRHAARCNGFRRLERRTDTALKTLHPGHG